MFGTCILLHYEQKNMCAIIIEKILTTTELLTLLVTNSCQWNYVHHWFPDLCSLINWDVLNMKNTKKIVIYLEYQDIGR